MQAVQRFEREKSVDGGKKKEAACIRHYFPRQGRRLEPRWRASREFHPSEVLSKLRTGVSL